MEEDGIRSARLIACVIAGIVGSLIPLGGIAFFSLLSWGFISWNNIIVITASGALGGYLGWLIMGKFGVKRFPLIVVAGIFGFFASIIAYPIFLLVWYWF